MTMWEIKSFDKKLDNKLSEKNASLSHLHAPIHMLDAHDPTLPTEII